MHRSSSNFRQDFKACTVVPDATQGQFYFHISKKMSYWIKIALIACCLAAPRASFSITPEEINNEQCVKFIDQLMHDLRLDGLNLTEIKKRQINQCKAMMGENYKNGLPSFATHSTKDVTDYLSDQQSRRSIKNRTDKDKALIKYIKDACVASAAGCLDLYENKKNGLTKSEQIRRMREFYYGKSDGNIIKNIARGGQFLCLDDLYAPHSTWNDSSIRSLILDRINICVRDAESAMLLR